MEFRLQSLIQSFISIAHKTIDCMVASYVRSPGGEVLLFSFIFEKCNDAVVHQNTKQFN